jgi:hypothetical protein
MMQLENTVEKIASAMHKRRNRGCSANASLVAVGRRRRHLTIVSVLLLDL